MAKKYLLYIHDERFENVEKKSQVINDLLAEHYWLDEAPKNIVEPRVKPAPYENLCPRHHVPFSLCERKH